MTRYQFTPQAIDDLFEIWSYIAHDSPDAANRVEDAIHLACAMLADAPLAGRIRKGLTARSLRFWPVRPYRNYLIAYDPETKPLQVIRLLHSARNIPSILR